MCTDLCDTGFGGANYYTLTQNGLRVCHKLFHVMFTPEVNPVRPRANCVATADGNIQLSGAASGARNVLVQAPQLVQWLRRLLASPMLTGSMPTAVTISTIFQDLPHPPAGVGARAGWGPLHGNHQRGIKRNLSDLEDHLQNHMAHWGHEVEEPCYPPGAENGLKAEADLVDVDLLRAKRLRHFDHLTNSTGSSRAGGSSSSRPTAIAAADPGEEELQRIELQSLLEYTEQQAAAEAARRDEERVMEAYVLSTALEESLERERPTGTPYGAATAAARALTARHGTGSHSGAASSAAGRNDGYGSSKRGRPQEHNDYETFEDYGYESQDPPQQVPNVGSPESSESQDADYRRAIAESLLTSTQKASSSGSSRVASTSIPSAHTTSAVARPSTVLPTWSVNAAPTVFTIDCDGDGGKKAAAGTPAASSIAHDSCAVHAR